jgi:two-component sensor histidine kinase
VLRSSGWSIRLRLLIWVGLVLLPPALLSILQGVANARRDVADLHEQLISTARAAATPAENILASARDIALALSHLPDIRDGSAQCNADLTSAMRGIAFISNMARVNASGRIVCAVLPKSIGVDASRLPAWRTVVTASDFVVAGLTNSQVQHKPIVLGLLPIRNAAGHFDGTLNVSIDVRWLNNVLKSSRLPRGSVMAIFDRTGNMIASTNAEVSRNVFARRKPEDGETAVRTAQDQNGMAWTYATATLLGPNVYVGFAMPDTRLFGETYRRASIDILLPFAMILLTWGAIWIVTDRQLTRWIIYLRRVSATYRSGHYLLRPAMDDAPIELKRLGDALSEMAGAIHERDRSLRDAIAQKSLLIKEIHHRVKNNLQVVMSLLSLQAKRLKDPVAQDALRDTSTRINALALVHRILYEIDDENTVDMRRLLEQLAEQTSEGFGGGDGRGVRVIADIAARSVPGDMAVTLSLFAVEAITNAFKHAFPTGRDGTIRVVLEAIDDHRLRFAIEDDGVGFDEADAPSSIGSRLIKTFGQQIGGQTQVRSAVGKGTVVEIVFSDPAHRADAYCAS